MTNYPFNKPVDGKTNTIIINYLNQICKGYSDDFTSSFPTGPYYISICIYYSHPKIGVFINYNKALEYKNETTTI